MLQVELVAEVRSLSLSKREADIGLRLSRPQEDLRALARKVGELRYGVYSREGLDASTLPWMTYEDGTNNVAQSEWISQRSPLNAPFATPRVNDAEGLLACVHAGLGKILLPIAIGERLPGLVRVSSESCELVGELWLLVSPDSRRFDRVRAVAEWVARVCGELHRTHAASLPNDVRYAAAQ